MRIAFLALSPFVVAAIAQTTYTGCHNHTVSSAVIEYCYGPNGLESPRGTYAILTSTGGAASAATASTTPAITSGPTTTAASGAVQTTAVTACHTHETSIFCINGEGAEVQVLGTPTGPVPAAYTGCHTHGSETFCLDPDGAEVELAALEASDAEAEGELSCHEHAGVEHCVGTGAHAAESVSCELRDRERNLGLRIGSVFIVLVTSSIGVFLPILFQKLPIGSAYGLILMILKQIGTGIIISTAFIHLYTHADLMFSNPCVTSITFEGTTSSIVMGGLFLAFLVEYVGLRITNKRKDSAGTAADTNVPTEAAKSADAQVTLLTFDHHHMVSNTKLSVLIMEAGIIFHSILIGLTLVVSGDGFYRTLLVVIVFHQFFEGLALGARIALLPGGIMPTKALMALAFSLVTPIGMAIGIGVLNSFNGNDPSTVITIGTLDALSAGILIWVGVVDMWAHDWVIEGGELLNSGLGKTLIAGLSLISGMVLMGVLGKWA